MLKTHQRSEKCGTKNVMSSANTSLHHWLRRSEQLNDIELFTKTTSRLIHLNTRMGRTIAPPHSSHELRYYLFQTKARNLNELAVLNLEDLDTTSPAFTHIITGQGTS